MRTLFALWLLLCCLPAAVAQTDCQVRILDIQAARAQPDGTRETPLDWQTVTLPHAWRSLWPAHRGSVWYRMDWSSSCGGAMAVGLTLESVVMAGEVYSNDDLIWRDASLVEPLSRSWNMPRHWVLPASSLREGVNTLWFRVSGSAELSAGLGSVHLGPVPAMQALSEDLWWRNRSLYALNLVVSLAMGGLFFCIWVVRRSQHDYGWYAAMALFWSLFIANVLLTSPWPLGSSEAMARANLMALVLYVACFCMFVWRFGEQRLPRLQRALWWVSAALLAMLAFAPDTYLRHALLIGVIVPALIFFANCLQFPFHAWRTRQTDHLVMAGGLLLFLLAGLHDFLLMFKLIPGSVSYTAFTSVVAMLSMSAVLGMRIARNMSRVERFNQELAERVQQARAELRTSLALEHSLELANTRLQDRLQMAHDLHDGPGGSLMRMMALVEQAGEPLQNRQVLSILKQVRDDLRQTIDSGCSEGVQVPATPGEWIAPLRHRFTSLFDELDIRVRWELPEGWTALPDAAQCQALTRLLEESLTNVIKHSRARHVVVALQQSAAGRLALRIEDDGVGFDVEAVRRCGISVGMRSMQARIARVGGSLEVASRTGLTVLTATLPQ
ncbi:sensor histidine kinase [Bordetella trematum]|uniref:sensor histidine kinase n=1 Tax=Bordetella trematum TaxID=123899 RepID=UPI000D81B0C4|nr:7TM diverse intracellular signaling domain-containing protein [Bordetella trematum]SPU49634.1 two-component sensor histidine kinase [Bordetella trematum]VDH07388.1 sensory histidine kinase UhpB [Bordetella trematum]